jgi:hypothetical protein
MLFGTVNGAIGVVAPLAQAKFDLFSGLQQVRARAAGWPPRGLTPPPPPPPPPPGDAEGGARRRRLLARRLALLPQRAKNAGGARVARAARAQPPLTARRRYM